MLCSAIMTFNAHFDLICQIKRGKRGESDRKERREEHCASDAFDLPKPFVFLSIARLISHPR